MTRAWKPSDFILNGEFADAHHLRRLVGKVRAATEADCAVLLVAHQRTFFLSLMYARCRDPKADRVIQQKLANIDLERNESVADALLKLIQDDRTAPLGVLLGQQLKTEFYKAPPDGAPPPQKYDRRTSRVLRPDLPSRRSARHTDAGPDVGVLCIGIGTGADAGPRPDPGVRRLLNKLTVAVGASAPLYLHRLNRNQARQRTVLNTAERSFEAVYEERAKFVAGKEPDRDLNSAYDEFLGALLRETGSDRGGIFMLRDSPKELHGYARIEGGRTLDRDRGARIDIDVKPARDRTDKIDLSAYVYHKKKAILVNGRGAFLRTNQQIVIPPFPGGSAPADTLLTVPIVVRRHRSNEVVSVGLIKLEKQGAAGGARRAPGYTLDDYQFALETARRVSDAWMHIVNNTLYDVVRRCQDEIHPNHGRAILNGPDYRRWGEAAEIVPADLESRRAGIQLLIDRFVLIADLVRSCSVWVVSIDQRSMVRLAHASQVTPADREATERRVAEYGRPAAANDNRPERLVRDVNERQFGVVLRSGREQHVSVGDGGAGGSNHISFPVMLANRIVGIVSFETAYASDALEFHADAMKSVAEAISKSFESAQISALAPILHPEQEVLNTTHELQKLSRDRSAVDNLNEYLRTAADPDADPNLAKLSVIAQELSAAFGRLDQCLKSLDGPRAVRGAPGAACHLKRLVLDVLAAENLGKRFKVSARPPDGYPPLTDEADVVSQEYVHFYTHAFRDLINNAVRLMTEAGHECGTITFHVRRLGNKSYACVTIRNAMADRAQLPPHLRPMLYRLPIVKTAGYHYGAFLAGWMIRATGGDLHYEQQADDFNRWHSVTVEIPL